MQFFLGMLASAFFFACVYGSYKLGQRSRVPVKTEVDEESQRKQKELRQGFEQLMSYDLTKAISGKR